MRIAFAFTGIERREDIEAIPTSHMSAVNDVLVRREWTQMGHQVEVLIKGGPIDAARYDLLYLWKLHAVRTFVHNGILDLPWRRVAAWMDYPGVSGDLKTVNHVAWGTAAQKALAAPTMPFTAHSVVEHAPAFPAPPELGESQPVGLFAGRLPEPYRRQVEMAARVCPMEIYALKVWLDGKWYLLRPGQYVPEDFMRVIEWCPAGSRVLLPVNMIAKSRQVSRAAFGLVTAARPVAQDLSACKFWDYLALGLPVVCADSVPEADYVRSHPMLGWTYKVGDVASMTVAIRAALSRCNDSDFADHRRTIQRWVFSRHTWAHRARELANAQFA